MFPGPGVWTKKCRQCVALSTYYLTNLEPDQHKVNTGSYSLTHLHHPGRREHLTKCSRLHPSRYSTFVELVTYQKHTKYPFDDMNVNQGAILNNSLKF